MAISISSSVIACLKSYNEFIEEIKQDAAANVRGLVAGPWEDELGRLRMWAANIGAHQTGQSSLDFRLRDASHVRDQIMNLLQGLLRRLQDARDVLADDEESEDGEIADTSLDEADPMTEIQELQESIATNINCLFQMSILVRKPASHDVYQESKHSDMALYEPWDHHHVRDKFPKADDTLVERLGNAITRRRKYLRYRERHAAKLRQGINDIDPGSRDSQNSQKDEASISGIKGILSDTVATDFQHQHIDFDNISDTGISQTSYAPTLLSGGNVTIPAPPKESSDGAPFECPYCFYVITVDGRHSWHKHVFQDLKPYVCMALPCTTPGKLYSTRHEWLHHSNMAHTAMPINDCTLKEMKGIRLCPLCKEEIESGKPYDRHLARHLQEVALFILPCGDDESDVSGDEASESTSNAESENLTASHVKPEMAGFQDEHLATLQTPDSPYAKLEFDEKEYENVIEREDILQKLDDLKKDLEEKQRLLGPENRDLLIGMHFLITEYTNSGRYREAQALAEQVMERNTKVLGSEHQVTLTVKSILATIYENRGWLHKAADLQEQIFETRAKALGPDHPDTLISKANSRRLHHLLRKDMETRFRSWEALEMRGEIRGWNNPRSNLR